MDNEQPVTDLRKAAEMAYAVPLHEQLEGVPEDARLVIEDSDGYGTRFIPVGRMCKEAAQALRQALAQPEQVLTARTVIVGREWVGLTDDEYDELMLSGDWGGSLIQATQDKLKEKNT
jgi:hypothetical protein